MVAAGIDIGTTELWVCVPPIAVLFLKQSITMVKANLDENLVALRRAMKSGTYQPLPRRRVYVPKGPGVCRPLGMPTAAERLLQRAVARIINGCAR